MTNLGRSALADIQQLRNKLWKLMPDATLKLVGI
jgi:hypothetical protein